MFGIGLTELTDILNRLESKAIRVRPRQCTRLRHRLSNCTRCADVCPRGAICWEDGLVVDSEKCTGCGACATVCPTGALTAGSPSLAELVESVTSALKGHRPIVFACERYQEIHPDSSDAVISVNCLARLDESILVTAATAGAEKAWLLEGACDGCPDAACREVTESSVSKANRLLEALGHPGRAILRSHFTSSVAGSDDEDLGQTKISRRGFFTLMTRQASRLGAVTAESVLASQAGGGSEELHKGDLPAFLPEKRRLLLEGMKRARRSEGNPIIDGLSLSSKFDFVETCTGCQMCAFFCPTGALRKLEKDGHVGVAFQSAHCTDCRLCEDMCYVQAVRLTNELALGQFLGGSVEEYLMREGAAISGPDSSGDRLKRSIIESLGLNTNQ